MISESYAKGELEIFFLDVGQGDAILIKTPDRKTILIDGGPDGEVLSQLSKSSDYFSKNIDLLVLSHPDSDHSGGLPEVLSYFKVENIMYTNIDHISSYYDQFNLLIDQNKLTRIGIFNERYFRIGCCVYLNILWPLNFEDLESLDPNDGSLSFELIYKNTNFFFGGDISYEIEEQIAGSDSWLDVDVLKVSHHGSKTSTSGEFLDRIKPELAIISAGRDNKFGHPHQIVLDELNQRGIEVLRTDQFGTIKISSDGSNIKH